jgi:prepilin-type N-terminal cleavage/methylation domain-containing protein
MSATKRAGFTVIELLVVIAVISLLMALLILGLAKLRNSTRVKQAGNLLQKLHTQIEHYNLYFRDYPPDTFAGRTGSQSLNYFLTTAFRTAPTGSEVQSDLDAGPMLKLEPSELGNPVASGSESIIDPWQTPLVYKLQARTYTDTMTKQTITRFIPILYSLGVNKTDETVAGTVPNDDIVVGQK